jgi:hypothetical protein
MVDQLNYGLKKIDFASIIAETLLPSNIKNARR